MAFNKNERIYTILDQEYGFIPEAAFKELSYRVDIDKIINNIHIRKVIMLFDDFEMRTYLYVPNDSKKHKTFIFIAHEYAEKQADSDLVNNYNSFNKYCPIDFVISKGYAVMLVMTSDVVPDEKRTKRQSIIKKIGVRSNNSWGALQAWSWAARKALDYLYTLPDEIDLNNVGVIGHSRGGKVALITAAQDERFMFAISSCSGNSGAALSRNNTGETIKDITKKFPYWFCKNYIKYAGNEEKLPFDQHDLIGAICPRYVYVFSGSKDSWACPKNESLSCHYATRIYNEMDTDGLVVPENINADESYSDGHIGYHIKTGSHCIEKRDWEMVISFIEKHRG